MTTSGLTPTGGSVWQIMYQSSDVKKRPVAVTGALPR